ncbi:MAG: DNA-3-methyladenine glycosylase [Planctomycetota bacterium]|nr:DNA-3-methyladenine glycosylase [Planctomycetota bacterium]
MTSDSSHVSAPRFVAFDADSETVAKRLLGQRLVRSHDGQRRSGLIVEVEAYLGATDKAAHTYGGRRTPRNESMYLPSGHLYVYFTYGMHHCMNVVCGQADEGVAVLLRAIEPIEGLESMRSARPKAKRDTQLCSGPARLTQALGIDLSHDGLDLRTSDTLFIEQVRKRTIADTKITRTPRIGVGYAQEWAQTPLRFCLTNNPHLSRRIKRITH